MWLLMCISALTVPAVANETEIGERRPRQRQEFIGVAIARTTFLFANKPQSTRCTKHFCEFQKCRKINIAADKQLFNHISAIKQENLV
jgi:hypothetical protein